MYTLPNYIDQVEQLGYKITKIPSPGLQCPLNILYLRDSQANLHAFLHPKVSSVAKEVLLQNNIILHGISLEIAEGLDAMGGGIRCITNEINTQDPAILKKLGI